MAPAADCSKENTCQACWGAQHTEVHLRPVYEPELDKQRQQVQGQRSTRLLQLHWNATYPFSISTKYNSQELQTPTPQTLETLQKILQTCAPPDITNASLGACKCCKADFRWVLQTWQKASQGDPIFRMPAACSEALLILWYA